MSKFKTSMSFLFKTALVTGIAIDELLSSPASPLTRSTSAGISMTHIIRSTKPTRSSTA